MILILETIDTINILMKSKKGSNSMTIFISIAVVIAVTAIVLIIMRSMNDDIGDVSEEGVSFWNRLIGRK